MNTADLDFHLPQRLIAQIPTPQRQQSRLLHYQAQSKSIHHRLFTDLPSLLRPGDLLVFNNSKVLPARFTLQKPTGGLVPGLFLSEESPQIWRVLLKNAGNFSQNTILHFENAPHLTAAILDKPTNQYRLKINHPQTPAQILNAVGRMPLPPYVKRNPTIDPRDQLDLERYQTVYAAPEGSVAAPTAGLHFTLPLLQQLADAGIQQTQITLHVGAGTFKTVESPTLQSHQMHEESYEISEQAAQKLNQAKKQNQRIIAIGTTAARVLESQPHEFTPKKSSTKIFIYPPFQWRHVNALLTNFHLPKSTLIALVAAKTGLEEQQKIYQQAIQQNYRFFSYGDTSFLE